jgi:hypothetical protein
MGNRIITPEKSILAKYAPGISDATVKDNVYKFMGCSVLSINMALGFNGTASSVTVNLVEDKQSGDVFTPPTIPSLWAISLPKGGVGKPSLILDGTDLNPDSFFATNTPFYFAGICTNVRESILDTGGQTIHITLADPREILNGVQCLLSGFSLSREVGVGADRSVDVHNVIDVFGYWNNGMESDRNEYGMPWYKILEVLQATRVQLYDLNFEFVFNGSTFTSTPNWYRIDEQIVDITALIQKVTQDGGADFVMIGRKIGPFDMVIEVRAIKRTIYNPLTSQELRIFINQRKDIIDSASIGEEFKNEPTSSIIVGGMKNANYLALPSTYDQSMHLSGAFEDYNAFPSDIKVRLFGGTAEITTADKAGSPVQKTKKKFKVQSGAIYPFWGTTADDNAYPLIEPFLSLEHLAFDKYATLYGEVTKRIPICQIKVDFFEVRVNPHKDVFLTDDGTSDTRPFAYLDNYKIQHSNEAGYTRGLPLNTEVLRAALISESAFYSLYSLYYPDIAESLSMPQPDWGSIAALLVISDTIELTSWKIKEYLSKPVSTDDAAKSINPDTQGRVTKGLFAKTTTENKKNAILTPFRTILYEQVRQYALDHMGKKFIVCLPRSAIMERIWLNLPVPTRPQRPEIEYAVADRGYWENVPSEFDGIKNQKAPTFEVSVEEQIRRRFMAEDGRFYAMAVIDWKPKGNVNFNSNGINKAMFQDLPASEYRPNRIAEGNPNYIFCSCSVGQLVKRPDLAIIDLPSQIWFDPTLGQASFNEHNDGELDDEFIAKKTGIMNFFWYHLKMNNGLRSAMKTAANKKGMSFGKYANKVFGAWADRLYVDKNLFYQHEMSTEIIMDLKGVVIPLNSTWMAYGPYYATSDVAKGMVKVEVDESLVPWNFTTPNDIEGNARATSTLDEAGRERLARTLSPVSAMDSAVITAAGFPEIGPAQPFGNNSNLTNISIDFGIGGVKTTYNFATYTARPGTYRKSDYDNVSRARIDTREKLPDIVNESITVSIFAPHERNKFPF